MKKIKLVILIFLFSLPKLLIAQTTIQFAGITWNVRSGTGGPGPNNWSDDSSSVWVDTNGQLHLKIRKVGNTWYCSEIYAQQSFGYGEYRFYVESNVENYDPNIVSGLFTYENDNRELDIEFSSWGDSTDVDGWYTIQPPPYNSSNQNSFSLNLSGNNSTHKFIWSSSTIFFQSYNGYSATLTDSGDLINQWTYAGSNNPPVGNERLHINFWLFSGNAPFDQQDAELIINAVYVPSGADVENVETKPLKIYPLPAKDRLTIESTGNVTMNKLMVFNSLGKIVFSELINSSKFDLNVSEYKSGIYIIRVQSANKCYTNKFCIFR